MNAPTQPWHVTPLCQQIIADMFALEDMSYRYRQMAREAGAKYPEEDETVREIGEMSHHYSFRDKRRVFTASGLIEKLFSRLDAERDQWIEDEGYRIVKERGLSLAHDAPDDVQDAICAIDDDLRRDTDTAERAVDLAIEALNKRAA